MFQYATLDYWLMVSAIFAGLLFRPGGNMLELRYVFAASMVLGFCGEGLLDLVGGQELKSLLLYKPQVAIVYRYVAALVLAFWVGYHVTRWRVAPKLGAPDQTRPASGALSMRLLIALSVIPLAIEVIVYGSDLILGTDDQARGLLAQDVENRPTEYYLRVIGRVIAFPLAVAAGLAWKQTKRRICWVVPTLLSLPMIAQFSRGMFLPFVAMLFGAVLLTRDTKKRFAYIGSAVGLVACSFVAGIAMREYVPTTGLGHFADLVRGEERITPNQVRHGFDTPLTSLVHATTALPRTSLAFYLGPRLEGHKKFGYFLRQLPIPSFLLPDSVPETNLTADLGLKRKSGIKGAGFPYPLVAEMKVFLGWLGCVIFFLIGWAAAKVDTKLNDTTWLSGNHYVVALVYGLALNFIVRSYHSGLRNSLRPIMYVTIGWVIWRALTKVRRPPVVRPVSALAAITANIKR